MILPNGEATDTLAYDMAEHAGANAMGNTTGNAHNETCPRARSWRTGFWVIVVFIVFIEKYMALTNRCTGQPATYRIHQCTGFR